LSPLFLKPPFTGADQRHIENPAALLPVGPL
jgi:hypothetical protein